MSRSRTVEYNSQGGTTFGLLPTQIILLILYFGNIIKLPLWLVWLPSIIVSIIILIIIIIYIYDEWIY
ncbi:MAG: hypothetical protein ACTSRG_22695 [Candidatus Helarchaeota archaeon]